MRSPTADADSRLSYWLRVREFAVPPSMIEVATVRRHAGDWAGACAAARVDVDLNPRRLASTYGRRIAAQVRDDLRHLAPDLLRWHMPRSAPDGLLRPGLTVALVRYDRVDRGEGPVYLVARTPPAWADAGQRISLELWDRSRASRSAGSRPHPHPHPHPRFRLDLHRHLWDARRAVELRVRSGADHPTGCDRLLVVDPAGLVPPGSGCAVDRWADEAAILLRDQARRGGAVAVRLGGGKWLALNVATGTGTGADVAAGTGAVAGDGGPPPPGTPVTVTTTRRRRRWLPVLPDAATWVLPDLELLRGGLIGPDRLHPLVAAALVPERPPPLTAPTRAGPERPTRAGPERPTRAGPERPARVRCQGADHRIAIVNGVLVPLDHDPAQIRREELLAALSGTPLGCLQAIDQAHRSPECLADIRARLDHGDLEGALAVVTALLGPDAAPPPGALRDELETAAQRRIAYGMYRAGLARFQPAPTRPDRRRYRVPRSDPRRAVSR